MATIDDLNSDLQKQSVAAQVELWELELSSSSTAYFFSGLDESLSQVRFRARGGGATINTYEALPIEGDGFSLQSDGPSARPTVTIANILTTFSGALQGLENKDLLGKKLYRRRTLDKYLYDTDTSDPAVEMPPQLYYIDRIAEESILHIKFELASPFDLAGIKLPKRVIMGNTCTWKYQGRAPEVAVQDRQGACSWSTTGLININGNDRRVYFNRDDEPVVSISADIQTSVASVEKNRFYRTTASTTNFDKINANGTLVSPGTVYDYWQATRTTSSPGTPSDDNPNFRRIRVYSTWSSSTEYDAYTDPQRNEYVRTNNKIYQVIKRSITTGATNPANSAFFKLGDQCSKSLVGCNARYCADWVTPSGDAGRPSVDTLRDKDLPFGGFPGLSN